MDQKVIDKNEKAEETTAKQSNKAVKSKAKDRLKKTRFQLMDPSSKTDLLLICDETLVELNLDDDTSVESDDDSDNCESDEEHLEEIPVDKEGNNSATTMPITKLFCRSCNVRFTELSEQRVHYTLDWHRYNIKRKMNGIASVTEAKFDEMIDDLSSIDGSDIEEEYWQVDRLLEKFIAVDLEQSAQDQSEVKRPVGSQTLQKSPKIFFKNSQGQVVSCYKAIVSGNRMSGSFSSKLIKIFKSPLRMTVIMASGGHFAAAVFEGIFIHRSVAITVLNTKRFTVTPFVRSKVHRKALTIRKVHVQELLASWSECIAGSDLVFYKAISANASILFHGKNPPLNKDSSKLRTIPFPTRRPTFSEVKRVHNLLTTVHFYESLDSFLAAHSHFLRDKKRKADKNVSSPKSTLESRKNVDRAKSRSPKRKSQVGNVDEVALVDEDDQVVDFNELSDLDDNLTISVKKKKKTKKAASPFKLQGVIKDLNDALQQKDIEMFKSLLEQAKSDGLNLNQSIDTQSTTLLHAASQSNQLDIVCALLNAGCDPSNKDKSGKYPYNYAESRECRETFRKFMKLHPDMFDYKKAQIPPPLTEEEEMARAEKKKLVNKRKRDKQKQHKEEKLEKMKEVEEQQRFLELSDREKRALAAEQRILAQCKQNAEATPVLVRCFECACDITGKVPFEYLQYVFCTPKCLAAHRSKFHSP